MIVKNSQRLLKASETVLLVVDIQEKLLAAMNADHGFRLVENTGILIKACRQLQIPIIVSEQYPKGLGHTYASLMALLASTGQDANTKVIEKTAFGCMDDQGIRDAISWLRRRQVLVCGMEAHVCVSQTVHQLLSDSYSVHVVQDAVISRKTSDYKTAMQKMRHSGAVPSTTEMAVFELLADSKHEAFKEIQALIK